MPKPMKLHSKGKPSSIQKPHNDTATDVTAVVDPEDAARQFQLELCWCIQQLEASLKEKKGNEKQLQEAWKVLTVLKNNNQPIIRKRQLMRTHFGDYRGKMAAEEKKLVKLTSKFKITDSPSQPKATFLRKSIFSSTGNESFKFNFDSKPDQRDTTQNQSDSKEVPKSDSDSMKSGEKTFKFSFSNSQFKFNFEKDNGA